MNDRDVRIVERRTYQAPTMTRVYVDPVRELLLQTACNFGTNAPPVCDNPCLPSGGTGGA